MFPWQEFDTVLFERGVSLVKENGNAWCHQSASSPVSVDSPSAVQSEFQLRPVVVLGPCGNSRVSMVLPATQGRLLDIYRSELDRNISRSLSFIMGAVLYHCKALAQWYTNQCLDYSSLSHKPDAERVVTTPEEPYFEFESLVTAIVRGYDTLRYPLWDKWGNKSESGCPNSFKRTLKHCETPPDLRRRLEVSNNNFLTKAKEYRDCIQHYIDFGSTSWAMMELLKDSVWSIIVRVPDNPEARSKDLFRFHRNVDALTLGWELSTELFAIVDILLGSGSLSTIPAEGS